MRLRLPFIVLSRRRFHEIQQESIQEGYRAGYEVAEEAYRAVKRGKVKAPVRPSRFAECPIPKPKRAKP